MKRSEQYHAKKADSPAAKFDEIKRKDGVIEKAKTTAVDTYVREHAGKIRVFKDDWTFDKLERQALGQKDEKNITEKKQIYREYLSTLQREKVELSLAQSSFMETHKALPKGLRDTLNQDTVRAGSPVATPASQGGASTRTR